MAIKNPAQTSFIVDEKTLQHIEQLKEVFGVSTNAAVIRRALALARVAAERADDKKAITIIGKDKVQERILLSE